VLARIRLYSCSSSLISQLNSGLLNVLNQAYIC